MDAGQMIQISTDGDITIVSFGSETIIGLSGFEQINEQLRTLISDNRPAKIVVDFDKVKFFSSQVLGLLVDIWRKLSEYGGIMLISGINPQLNRIFKITNLDKIFEFYPDRAGAIKAIKDKEL